MERKPDGLDWDRWLGPGPKIAWNPDVYFSPYKWLHYDGGMIMGIGIHVIDTAHQFMNLSKPSAAVAGGGVYNLNDRDTPDVINLILEYPQHLNVTFEAEIMTVGMKSSYAGIELHGTGGLLTVNRYRRDLGYEYIPHPKNSTVAAGQGPGDPSSPEWLLRNWFECIRTREKTVANEVEGYYSSMACFMGNQAYRTKSRITWDGAWDLPA
jgi:predicted dehydrogenase